MSDIAIRVENLSKQYRIGGPQAGYKTLRESLVGAARAPVRRAGRLLRGEAATDRQETIWALKDVSFEVKHGEVLGIIGRNGAGKSTLLKILSRITAPTEGVVDLYGRVGSLLEVGTGFHPELTGRENVYLNGAILGMKRAEIDHKFDEIVAFAELEKFLDTPVKHYSSGMYVRLAFAVAAYLDPEILLVDEVLAVGDAAFQKKCLGKMGEVAEEGRTVLFVSHNMGAVEGLCKRGIVLDGGTISFVGSQTQAVNCYYDRAVQRRDLSLDEARRGNGLIRVKAIEFLNEYGQRVETLRSGQNIEVRLAYEGSASHIYGRVHVGITVKNMTGLTVFSLSTRMVGVDLKDVPPSGSFVCHIPRLPLPATDYLLEYAVKLNEEYADAISDAVRFTVLEGDFFPSLQGQDPKSGICLVEGEWRLEH